MALYMQEGNGRMSVRLGRITPFIGRPFYVLTAYRIDPQRTDERVVLTDSAGRMLKWTNKRDAMDYAHSHDMYVYDTSLIIMGGTSER